MFSDFIHAADLRLFEGGAGAASGGDGAAAGSQAQAANSQTADTGGDTAADAGQENTRTPEQIQKEFQQMIRGEYKDAYDKQFQKQFQKHFDARFKNVKEDQERLQSYQPIIDTLAARYGITDGDMAKLAQAIDADEALWYEAAEQAGLSVEQFRRVQRIELENQRLKAERRQDLQQQMAQRQMQMWMQQAQQVRQVYPDFDPEAELQDPAFKAMLRAGASMMNAYEATHLDMVKADLAKKTAEETTKRVTDKIKEKGMRPSEVGGSQSGVPLDLDLKNSTAKQRAEWARRAERGETISFS